MFKSPDHPSDIHLPPYPYIPGRNARHPEDWFDEVKSSMTENVPIHALHQTQAWRAGLAYFHAGFFWESHEVLEAVWLRAPEGTPEREMTQAIIQLANARLKLKMEKPRAALRLCAMVEEHLDRCPVDRPILGLDVAEIAEWNSSTRKAADDGTIVQTDR